MDSTNNLIDILGYNGNILLKPFLIDIVGMEIGQMEDVAITPLKAAENFNDRNDFLIKFTNDGVPQVVIVVNRNNDVPDHEHQIDRYVYGALDEDIDFEKWIGDPAMHCAYDDEYYYMRLVFITKDGKKWPSKKSLTGTLKKNIGSGYVPVTYLNDILPWLKSCQSFLPRS